MQFHTVELYLCQICLFDRKCDSSMTPSISWSPWHLEILCSGLVAAKSLFDFYLSLPLRTEMAFNNSEWVQISFGLTVASKLAVTATKASFYHQTMSLRRSLNMSDILKQSIFRTTALATTCVDADGDRDVFYHYEQRVRLVQRWFVSNFIPEHNDSSEHNTNDRSISSHDIYTGASNTHDIPLPDGTYDFQWTTFFPDATIDEALGDWMI